MDITIRKAKKGDMSRVHELIMELAVYEKLAQEVEVNQSDLVYDGFGTKILIVTMILYLDKKYK